MNRTMKLGYGVLSYGIGMGALFYMQVWLINAFVPWTIDSHPSAMPLGLAICLNIALFGLFGLQHSIMARPQFKAWWTQYIPAELERSTYVLMSGIGLFAMMACWQSTGITIWDFQNSALRAIAYVIYVIGWVILVGSSFALNHFDLFGLRQTWLAFANREYTHLKFATPGPYRLVRHPIYVGWITLVWATPTMSLSHLVLAVATTGYILIAVQFEERDLLDHHGEDYRRYCETTPMLVPSLPQADDTTYDSLNEPIAAGSGENCVR